MHAEERLKCQQPTTAHAVEILVKLPVGSTKDKNDSRRATLAYWRRLYGDEWADKVRKEAHELIKKEKK